MPPGVQTASVADHERQSDAYTDGRNVIVRKIRINDTPDSDRPALVLLLEE